MLGVLGKIISIILLIIGIILLLGLILLLIVLISSIRYAFRVSYYNENIKVKVSINWILHILRLEVDYRDDVLDTTFRVFGIRIYQRKVGGEYAGNVAEEDIEKAAEKAGDMVDNLPPPVTDPKDLEQTADQAFQEKREERKRESDKEDPKEDSIKQKKESPLARIEKLITFLKQETTKTALSAVKRELMRCGRRILPGKLEVEGIFGFEDPALTGQALGVLALLYPIYKDNIKISADFENKVLEGKIYVNGRFRMGSFVLSGLRLLGNKEVRRLFKRIKHLV